MENPFDCGSGPVKPEKFIGRDNEIQTIAQGLRGKASFVVVGEPKSGKTSLLNYLSAREKRDQLYKRQASHLIFNYLDIQARLNPLFTPQDFWLWALQPVTENLSNISDVMRHYELCKANRFTVSKLKRLLETLEDLGWKLVLLIDEFDDVLQHPNLNSAEFYGGIRSLSTRLDSLSIVLATRTREKVLENRIKKKLGLDFPGSPYLNFAQERILPPLTDDSINALLKKAPEFMPPDRYYVSAIAGGHPYLLQVTAGAMWNAYRRDDLIADKRLRYQWVSEELYSRVEGTIQDIWDRWSPEKQRAFITAGIDEISSDMICGEKFYVTDLQKEISYLVPELRELSKQGFVVQSNNGEWKIGPRVYLWWLADQIIRMTREEKSTEEWLERRQGKNILTYVEKRRFLDALKKVQPLLIEGATTLIVESVKKFVNG